MCASAGRICRSRFPIKSSAACRANGRGRRRSTAPRATKKLQEIRAKADRDVVVIQADAQRQADQTRGAGDAERNRIFAEAYGKDPDFFAFYRSMQAYETALEDAPTRASCSRRNPPSSAISKCRAGSRPRAGRLPAPRATIPALRRPIPIEGEWQRGRRRFSASIQRSLKLTVSPRQPSRAAES